jgi:hypothetical protein
MLLCLGEQAFRLLGERGGVLDTDLRANDVALFDVTTPSLLVLDDIIQALLTRPETSLFVLGMMAREGAKGSPTPSVHLKAEEEGHAGDRDQQGASPKS